MNPLMYRPQPLMPYFHYPQPFRRAAMEEEDLASVTLQIQSKRFYVDVKRNQRGFFMKIAEVSVSGRKARIVLTMNAAEEIKDKLKDLVDVLETLNTENNTNVPESDKSEADGIIKSHVVKFPYRRYFLDLKRNHRGHFLRLTMLSALHRVQIAVPSQGMSELYVTIRDLLGTWWDTSKPDGYKLDMPESKSMRVDNRTLYFDPSYNKYGPFLRISEVKTSSRTAINIPNHSLSRFCDIVNGLADELLQLKASSKDDVKASTDIDSKEHTSVHSDSSPIEPTETAISNANEQPLS